MKTCIFYVLLVLLAWGCESGKARKVELKDLVFRCTVTEAENEPLIVGINGVEQVFEVPANGVVEIKVPQIAPQYSSITYGRKFYPLYLAGGEPVEMTFSGNVDNWKRTFSGNCKEINEYLSSSIAPFESSLFYKNEEALKEETEKLIQQNTRNLESKKLPKDFTDTEKVRLRYLAYASWNTYRMNHRWMAGVENFEPSDLYYNTMQELAGENADWVGLKEYRRFVQRTIETLATRGTGEQTPEQVIDKEIKYILENYKDSVLLGDLMHHFIYEYATDHGVGEKKELAEYYKQYVKDPQLVKDFETVCATWGKVQPGSLSPSFNFPNAKGENVSLESFRGKYVYIDLWASWCAPCRREIPFLKKLEQKFKGKDIVFVSISCDREEEAWRKAMEEEKVSGIQLFVNGDLDFAKAYVVSGIPRFILLDKEGRIVDAHMTAPSDPKTEEMLRELTGLEG